MEWRFLSASPAVSAVTSGCLHCSLSYINHPIQHRACTNIHRVIKQWFNKFSMDLGATIKIIRSCGRNWKEILKRYYFSPVIRQVLFWQKCYTDRTYMRPQKTKESETKILYLQGWEANPLQSRLAQQVHTYSTVLASSGKPSYFNFWDCQQLLHCFVLNFAHCKIFCLSWFF
jgi:hypothetical protein